MASVRYMTTAHCKPIPQAPITAQDIAMLLETNQAICKAEAARRAGVSTAAVAKWIVKGRRRGGQTHYLPAAKWAGGDMTIILAADLARWLREFPPMPQKRSRTEKRAERLETYHIPGKKLSQFVTHGARLP